MLHASAAFKGGDIQKFWEGGEPYVGELDNPLETMIWIHVYKLNYTLFNCVNFDKSC